MEHQWRLVTTGDEVLVGEDSFPKPEHRARAREVTLFLPHCSASFSTRIPQDAVLIFFRSTQIDMIRGSGEEAGRSVSYTLGYRAKSGEKSVQVVTWDAVNRVHSLLTCEDGRGELDAPAKLRELLREGECSKCGACCEGCLNLRPPNHCFIYDGRGDGCKTFPRHPFYQPNKCAYTFIDAMTKEPIPRGKAHRETLTQYRLLGDGP